MNSYLIECEFNSDHQAAFDGETFRDAQERAEKVGWYFTENEGNHAMCPDCKRSLERDFVLRFQRDVSQWFICEVGGHKRVYSGPSGNDMVERARNDGWFIAELGATWDSICPDCVDDLKATYRDTGGLPFNVGHQRFANQLMDYIEAQIMAEADAEAQATQEAAAQAGCDAVKGIDLAEELALKEHDRIHAHVMHEAAKRTADQLAQMREQAFATGTIRNLAPDLSQDAEYAHIIHEAEQLASEIDHSIRDLSLSREEVAKVVQEAQVSRLCSPNRSSVSPYSYLHHDNPDCPFQPYQVQGETTDPKEPHFFMGQTEESNREWRGLRNGFLIAYRDIDREDGSGERYPIAIRNLVPWFIEERWHRLGSAILDQDSNKMGDGTSEQRTGNEDEETAQLFATAPALYRVLWALCIAYENGEEAEDMQPLFEEAAQALAAATLAVPVVLTNSETGIAVTRKCLHPDMIDYLNDVFKGNRLPLKWEIDEA